VARFEWLVKLGLQQFILCLAVKLFGDTGREEAVCLAVCFSTTCFAFESLRRQPTNGWLKNQLLKQWSWQKGALRIK